MSSVVISGNTSGTCTLSAPDVAGSTTLTLPATSGTVVIGTTPSGTIVGTTDTQTLTNKTLGNTVVQASNAAPAFSAYLTGTQSVTTSTFTKVTINTEEFDTNSNYDNATNYRFTPTVAGYYQVNGVVDTNTTTTGALCCIYKNGANFKTGNQIASVSTGAGTHVMVSCLVFLNGSTDYIELWAYATGTTPSIFGGASDTYFQASFVRSA